jgi:membrane-associated HD superfamily phosphohydrolase
MKNIFLALSMIALSTGTFAQQQPPPPPKPLMEQGPRGGRFGRRGEKGPDKEKIEMLKIDFFTKKLSLTKAEAELFWPVYEAHKKAAKEIMDNRSNDEIQVQEAMLAARKKFKSDLKPVLKSDERINEALKADREFLQEIRQEMMRRKGFRA